MICLRDIRCVDHEMLVEFEVEESENRSWPPTDITKVGRVWIYTESYELVELSEYIVDKIKDDILANLV